MRDWFEEQLAAGLPAFRGSSLSATIAIKDEVVNQWLARWLSGEAGVPTLPAADPAHAKRFVRKLSIRTEQGTLLLDLELSV